MESAPVPPHERTWRHPSELAADHRAAVVAERPSTAARTIALLTGTAGILLVGVVVLALTPQGASSPPVAIDPQTTRIEPSAVTTALAIRARDVARDVLPLATPIRPGTLGVTPSKAVHELISAGRNAVGSGRVDIDVRLGDGSVLAAAVIDPGSGRGLALVEFHPGSTPRTAYPVAAEMPAEDDLVTILVAPPMTMTLASIVTMSSSGGLEIDDGTPVVNQDGHLVGLCTEWDRDRPARFTPIAEVLSGANAPRD